MHCYFLDSIVALLMVKLSLIISKVADIISKNVLKLVYFDYFWIFPKICCIPPRPFTYNRALPWVENSWRSELEEVTTVSRVSYRRFPRFLVEIEGRSDRI